MACRNCFVGFFEMKNYLESFNNHPLLYFQGPRGLRGLQGPMGAVGDRVSDFWNAVRLSTLQLLSCERRKRIIHKLPRVSFSFCPQGLPGFRGKPGIAGIIGKTVSLFLFVVHIKYKRPKSHSIWWWTAARRDGWSHQ